MSVRESFEDVFASPARARSLFTVRAAISSALSSDAPRPLTLSLMCLYCRSRFLLHACCGIRTPFVGSRVGFPERAGINRLRQRGILDVVLGRVLVRELVHDVEALAVGVVDLDERLP